MISTLPPSSSAADWTTSRPTPRPLVSVTVPAVENAGTNSSCHSAGPLTVRVGRKQAVLDGLGPYPVLVDAGAVVGRPRGRRCRRTSAPRPVPCAGPFLPAARRCSWVCAAVVDRVDDEVLERVGDPVEHLLVELDVLADQLEPYVLAGARWRRRGRSAAAPANTRRTGTIARPMESSRTRAIWPRWPSTSSRSPRAVSRMPVVGWEQPVQRRASPRRRAARRRGSRCSALLHLAWSVAMRQQLGRGLLDPAGAQLGLADDVEQAVHLLAGHPYRVAAGACACRRWSSTSVSIGLAARARPGPPRRRGPA